MSRIHSRASGLVHMPRRATFVMAAALITAGSARERLTGLSIHAQFDGQARAIRARIGTEVPTPLGAISVSGTARASYSCDGVLHGTVEYPAVVRLLAKMRHVTLVRYVDGEAVRRRDEPPGWMCPLPSDSVVGRFSVADSSLSGSVRAPGGTAPVAGSIVQRGLADAGAYEIDVHVGSDESSRRVTIRLRGR